MNIATVLQIIIVIIKANLINNEEEGKCLITKLN